MYTTSAIFGTKLIIMIYIIIFYDYHDCSPLSIPVDMNGILKYPMSDFSHDNMTLHPQVFLFNFLNDDNILGLLLTLSIGINDISANNVNGYFHNNIFFDHNPIYSFL